MEKDVEGSCGLMKGRPINTVNLSGNYTYHLVYNSEECTYWYRMSFRIRSHCLPQQQKPQDIWIQLKNPGHVPGTEKTQEHFRTSGPWTETQTSRRTADLWGDPRKVL